QFVLALKPQDILPHLSSPRLDGLAIATFFLTGLYLDDRTPFENIHCVPEGGLLTWSPGGDLKRSVRPSPEQVARGDYAALQDTYIQLFRDAILSTEPASVFLPLSGGCDSRHILLELLRQNRPVSESVTVEFFPPKYSTDSLVAVKL